MICLDGCVCLFQAEDGIRDLVRSRGLGDVYKRQVFEIGRWQGGSVITALARLNGIPVGVIANDPKVLSLIHI